MMSPSVHGQAARLDTIAVGGFQTLIDRQVLVELLTGEDIVAEVTKLISTYPQPAE